MIPESRNLANFARVSLIFCAAILAPHSASAQDPKQGPVTPKVADQAQQQQPPATPANPATAQPQSAASQNPTAAAPSAAAQQDASQAAPPSSATSSAPATAAASGATAAPAKPASLEVPSGTKIPLILHNAITTRNANPGDPVYMETLFPIVLHNKILIPAGSYVQGEVQEAVRPGKVKGTGELRIKLNTMILPNGYTVDFNAVPTNAGTGGNESTDKEGTIHGDTDKSTDAGTIIKGTAIGAGIGGIATRSAGGAGIGAGIGAAAGLAAVLLTRGPELELPRGTTFDIELTRAVFLDASQITFTDPGKASTMPGPPNREPSRSRSPF